MSVPQSIVLWPCMPRLWASACDPPPPWEATPSETLHADEELDTNAKVAPLRPHIWIPSHYPATEIFTPDVFFVERILSCLVMIQPDWMDWYFQTIARVKNRSCFRIMAVTLGAEFLSSLNKTWRQFLQFNLFERAPKIYPWLPLVTIISELSMGPQRMDEPF